MFGMNVNGVVNGAELRSVTQEIFGKAQTSSKSLASDAGAANLNPFAGVSPERSEFIPQQTKAAKAGFQQNSIDIDPTVKQSVNSQAAIDKYASLSFGSPSKASTADVASEMITGIANMESAEGGDDQKNPLMMLLAALLKDRQERTGDDPIESIFAMAAKAGAGNQ